jgi:NAD(P)-dependent dehydrogenase (short-subunit alcohol dehydrogenase family)
MWEMGDVECEKVANSRQQHLVKNLAVELGPRHILVNAIAPGFFPSKMSNGLLEASVGVEAFARANPSGRLGEPEDIAGAVVYMASRAGSHLNGAVLAIDGGEHLVKGKL